MKFFLHLLHSPSFDYTYLGQGDFAGARVRIRNPWKKYWLRAFWPQVGYVEAHKTRGG